MLKPGRRGFTLLEIIVSTAIVAILGAAIFMTMASYDSTTRVRQSHDILRDLNTKLHVYDSLLGSNTLTNGVPTRNAANGRYPQMLSHLTNAIALGSNIANVANCTNCMTSCGTGKAAISSDRSTWGYQTIHPQAWNARGPFDDRYIVVNRGFPIPIGFVKDLLVRTPAQSTSSSNSPSEAGLLQIQIDSVRAEDANDLKLLVDGQTDTPSAGTIRWSGSPDAGGRQTIFWSMRVRGC